MEMTNSNSFLLAKMITFLQCSYSVLKFTMYLHMIRF